MKKSEEEENEKRSTKLEFTCWPSSKPGWALCAAVKISVTQGPWARPCSPWMDTMEPSGTTPPTLKPSVQHHCREGRGMWQRGDRWCHNKILSLSPYFSPLLLLFRTAPPKADRACSPHVRSVPAMIQRKGWKPFWADGTDLMTWQSSKQEPVTRK